VKATRLFLRLTSFSEVSHTAPILVGHSLGGILVKQALVNGHANPKHKNIINSTFALVVMGTPHTGPTNSSKVAFGKICAKIVKKVNGSMMNDFMMAVENGSLFSDILKENSRHQLEQYQIISRYETINEVYSLPMLPFALM
jgi:triacylglycerol esterase/lipase EstA (alpha/beta hydrolase family)